DFAAALELYRQCLAENRALGLHGGIVSALSELGWTYHQQGNYAAALPFYEQRLAAQEEVTGDPHGKAAGREDMAHLPLHLRHYGQVVDLSQRSLALAEKCAAFEIAERCWRHIGDARQAEGAPAEASAAYEKAIAALETMRARAFGGVEAGERLLEDRPTAY